MFVPVKALAIAAVLLVASVGANLWQLYRAGKASEACETRIATLTADAYRIASERDTEATEVARLSAENARLRDEAMQINTAEAITRVRTITRTIPIPADCPVALDNRVQAELSKAAAAANR